MCPHPAVSERVRDFLQRGHVSEGQFRRRFANGQAAARAGNSRRLHNGRRRRDSVDARLTTCVAHSRARLTGVLCAGGHVDVVRLLLERGAEVSLHHPDTVDGKVQRR